MVALLLSLALQEADDARIGDFASKVRAENETLQRFVDSLRTREGRIVLRDRAGRMAQELLRQAQREAFPEYLRVNFLEENGAYRLREEKRGLRDRMLEGHRAYLADIDKVRAVAGEIADHLVDLPEANKKLREFLRLETTAEIVYLSNIRGVVRPDRRALERELGQLFAPVEGNQYVIPETRVDRMRELLEAAERKHAAARKMQQILRDAGIAEADDLHRRLRKAIDDVVYPIVLARNEFNNNDPRGAENAANNLGKNLAQSFEKKENGLVLKDSAVARTKQLLDAYDRARGILDGVRPALRAIVERISEQDELHVRWKTILREEYPVLPIAERLTSNEPDPGAAFRAQLFRAVQKEQDGTIRIRPEAEGQVMSGLQRGSRELQARKDRGRNVDAFAAKLADEELKAAYLSNYGKMAVEEATRDIVASKKFDGLGAWIARHFDLKDGAHVLRAASAAEIQAMLGEAEKIRKEMGKDDFPP